MTYEILSENDLKKYFYSEKFSSVIDELDIKKKQKQETICKCFFYGLSINGIKFDKIFYDEIENSFDENIPAYIISNYQTFKKFENNQNANLYFNEFIKSKTFEFLDNELFNIAETRFDWFNNNFAIGKLDANKKNMQDFQSDFGNVYSIERREPVLFEVSEKENLYRNQILEIISKIDSFRNFQTKIGYTKDEYKNSLMMISSEWNYLLEQMNHTCQLLLNENNEKYEKLNKIILFYRNEFQYVNKQIETIINNLDDINKKFDSFREQSQYATEEMMELFEERKNNIYDFYKAGRFVNRKSERKNKHYTFSNNINLEKIFQKEDNNIEITQEFFENVFLINRVFYHKKNIDLVKQSFEGILND